MTTAEKVLKRYYVPDECPKDHTSPVNKEACKACGFIHMSNGCCEPLSYDELLGELVSANDGVYDIVHFICNRLRTELAGNAIAEDIEFNLQSTMSYHYRREAMIEQVLAHKILKGDTE